MKRTLRIELDKTLAETIAILILCVSAIIVVNFISIKQSETIETIELRLEQLETINKSLPKL